MKFIIDIPAAIMDEWAGDVLSGVTDNMDEKTPAECKVLSIVVDAISDQLVRMDTHNRKTMVPS